MIITFGNFKGGIGKTTTTLLFGYILEKMYSKKVLLIDTDPQMNLTELAEMSYKQ
ncbi:MAG TPA: ParA family protein, partial [Pseudogracilibacillus sp.]|nr:ParA family protein [Pseudogracilibacillus sp.]